MPQLDQLAQQLDRLAAFEPGPFPVVTLYLNTQPDQRGRDHFDPFLRKTLGERLRTYAASGPERQSLERDGERIRDYVAGIDASANGAAIFACSGADLFEAVQMAAPIDAHRLYVSDQPHLYPLARLIDEYPRYAVLLADTHLARIFVFAINALERTAQVEGTKTRRHKMGGWSQARYQRHMENFHQQHAKEAVDTLERIVREERIGSVVLAGDEVIVPLVRGLMPKALAEKIVDVLKLDIRARERDVFETTIAAMREKDAETDRERVDALIGAYRANGLAVVGADATRRALELGEVDELLISATPEMIAQPGAVPGGAQPDRSPGERAADDLVAGARRTGARIRIIEDASLLAPIGGAGARLRFKAA